MKTKWIVILALVSFPGLSGCGEQEQPVPSHTVWGTVTSSTVDASRRLAWIKLVGPEGSIADVPQYAASCYLQGPSCEYKINFVTEAEYKAYGLIDMNGNASEPGLEPDSSDLVSFGKPMWVWERTQADFPDEAWRLMP